MKEKLSTDFSKVDKETDAVSPYKETWTKVRSHPIFEGISDTAVRSALPYFRVVTFQPGQFIIEEGGIGPMELYLILTGELEVIKRTVTEDHPVVANHVEKQFVIARLSDGDSVGELSFLRGDSPSASIKSASRSLLLALHPDEFSGLEAAHPVLVSRMMKNLVGYVGDNLRKTSANEVRALKTELQNSILNSKANLFFSYIICLLCVYNLTIHLITNLSIDTNRASVVSALIIAIFCVVLILMIRQSRIPAHVFGITTRNWKPAVRESLYWTAGIISVLVLIKWILIQNVPRYHDLDLIDFNLSGKRYLAFNFVLYGLHSPIQEFIARGVLQGSLQHFFKGRNITWRAILISNALFSATHVHLMNGLLGVIVFIPGLFWGWLYSRHENLIGVSISHILIGWSALFFLNIESLF